MAKKETPKSDVPVVTSLPLPSSDSVLVIDLPDGQKLLVGKMSPGSVIEVATWRGTGRPDSRTNRLMLGMSNGEYTETVQEPEAQAVSKLSLAYLLFVIKNIPPFAVLLVKKIQDLIFKVRKRNDEIVENSTPDREVEEWLNRLTSTVSDSGSMVKAKTASKTNSRKSSSKNPKKPKKAVNKSSK